MTIRKILLLFLGFTSSYSFVIHNPSSLGFNCCRSFILQNNELSHDSRMDYGDEKATSVAYQSCVNTGNSICSLKSDADGCGSTSRRKALLSLAGSSVCGFGFLINTKEAVAATAGNNFGDDIPTSLKELAPLVKEARTQLDAIPSLIKEGKWDSVRAVLITPPISDCWSKSSKLLLNLANAIGDELPDGDELAALEAREEAGSHLRYLDMAVYNNNFNPIATEGETGATKELIRSYYEDPKNELKASIDALDELIKMLP